MSSTKRDAFNQILKDHRRFYEEDFVVLVTHLTTRNTMDITQIAHLIGTSKQALSKRINRYKQEQGL